MLTLTIKDKVGYLTDGENIHSIPLDDFELEDEDYWTAFKGEILGSEYTDYDVNICYNLFENGLYTAGIFPLNDKREAMFECGIAIDKLNIS